MIKRRKENPPKNKQKKTNKISCHHVSPSVAFNLNILVKYNVVYYSPTWYCNFTNTYNIQSQRFRTLKPKCVH